MNTQSELQELIDMLYAVRSFADKIHFRIESEIDDLIEIVNEELDED